MIMRLRTVAVLAAVLTVKGGKAYLDGQVIDTSS
ncbi:hypothetical protein SAMN04489716_0858 [Actinoplanes derwentensis]|uniref:Uncharacterized protein n=1 Tax=Actinoplanes derwentensis TaxID=113562 RepID=A0A1H1SGV1_9ACTN|nr:hypothetical protein SAMN04489716_0858 [Actinoplanes derwentensis]